MMHPVWIAFLLAVMVIPDPEHRDYGSVLRAGAAAPPRARGRT